MLIPHSNVLAWTVVRLMRVTIIALFLYNNKTKLYFLYIIIIIIIKKIAIILSKILFQKYY